MQCPSEYHNACNWGNFVMLAYQAVNYPNEYHNARNCGNFVMLADNEVPQ